MEKALAIFAIVERGLADRIVEKTKEVGAVGATIFYGRGTGTKEAKKLFNMHVESSKEAMVIITKEDKAQPIIDCIIKEARLNEPGTGILFTTEISNLVGLHQGD